MPDGDRSAEGMVAIQMIKILGVYVHGIARVGNGR
jgi:hypothetical protein